MATATRVYSVGYGSEVRLVRASHRQQALSHVAQSIITVNVATQDQLIDALSNGVKIEDVRDHGTVPLDLPAPE